MTDNGVDLGRLSIAPQVYDLTPSTIRFDAYFGDTIFVGFRIFDGPVLGEGIYPVSQNLNNTWMDVTLDSTVFEQHLAISGTATVDTLSIANGYASGTFDNVILKNNSGNGNRTILINNGIFVISDP
jgi:hypothetical protein